MKSNWLLIPTLLAATAATADKPHDRWQAPIDIEEAQARASERFAAMDSDGDGMLTPEEHAAGADFAHRVKKMRRYHFNRMDDDGDGSITADEFAARIEKLSQLDSNSDGTLTRDELRAGRHRLDSKQRRNR